MTAVIGNIATSSLDAKARIAIAFLLDRRKSWAVITYGDLADRIGHPQHLLGEILDRVGAWSASIGKQSLAMLVISVDGEPREGMYRAFPGETDPVTPANYDRRRVQLWREDWSGVTLPTPMDIAGAYADRR